MIYVSKKVLKDTFMVNFVSNDLKINRVSAMHHFAMQ